MNTLNTIIEEEKKAFEGAFMNNGVNGVLGDEFQEPKMLLMRTHFTTAMQRAYEAGRQNAVAEMKERIKEYILAEHIHYSKEHDWQFKEEEPYIQSMDFERWLTLPDNK